MTTISSNFEVSERPSAPPVVRVPELTVETFVSQYIAKNQPIIVTGAMDDWKALKLWQPQHLAERFGTERVQVYGDLFRLANIMSLSAYFEKYFGQTTPPEPSASVPYVRWYCHLAADERVPWADDIFTRFAQDWARPAFFPADSFALPFCPPSVTIDPTRDWFPARGLFISAKGARTRLHADPWASDALLCQIYGDKDFVMYDPSQAAYLSKDGKAIDIEKPDLETFPDFPQARASMSDTLRPGELLFVPAGWHHHFKSATDSISLTWNFVHLARLPQYLAHLAGPPSEAELKQLAYAYFASPGHRVIDGASFIASLMNSRGTGASNRAES